MRPCRFCGKSIVYKNAQARFCSDKCRNYARRAVRKNPIPFGMTGRDRWVRRSAQKVPLTIHGTPASSTDPSTWSSYLEARASSVGAGLGYIVGDGIGCLDLDHCLNAGEPTAAAQALLERYPDNYIEISPSGDGLHVWGLLDEAAGTKRTIDGLAIETYSRDRYITITGNVYQPGRLAPL